MARELAVFDGIRRCRDRLHEELGEQVADMLPSEAETTPTAYPHIRRVNIVARKR
jgi:hypothetical protein